MKVASIFATAMLALGVTLLMPARSAAQAKAPENWTARDLQQAIEKAETRADHEKLAAYYRQDAVRLKQQSEGYQEMAQIYAGFGMTKPTVANGAPHCELWAKLDAEAANKADALASMHENIANNTPE